MAFLKIPNVKIKGLASAVPTPVKEIMGQPFFAEGEAEKVIALTGIERTRCIPEGQTASDLGYEAANQLLNELGWNRDEIEVLVYVSLARDYVTPPTSVLLQERLGLPRTCYCIDIPMACAGYVYGISMVSTLMSMGKIKKGLLIAGDTTSIQISPLDKGLWPLQGDSMSATAFEYDETADPIYFNSGADGAQGDAIIMPSGGTRNPFKAEDLEMHDMGDGSHRRGIDAIMDGMSVFGFAITDPPKTIKAMVEHFGLNIDEIDYFIVHQANKYIVEKIARKLKIPKEKIPLCLKDFGNTSSGSIALSATLNLTDSLPNQKATAIISGFGSGLTWASAQIVLDHIVSLPLIEVPLDEKS